MKLTEILESEGLTCAIPYAAVGSMLKQTSDTCFDDQERAISFCGDGQRLAFPSMTGRTRVVPTCPPDKEHIGDFHVRTVESALRWRAEKSIRDWDDDLRRRNRVSCVGTPEVEEGVLQNAIVCHTFKIDHPEYEAFRNRFLAASSEAAVYEKSLSQKRAPKTKEEYETYQKWERSIKGLIDEGIAKGIISACCPIAKADKFTVPDLARSMEAQR